MKILASRALSALADGTTVGTTESRSNPTSKRARCEACLVGSRRGSMTPGGSLSIKRLPNDVQVALSSSSQDKRRRCCGTVDTGLEFARLAGRIVRTVVPCAATRAALHRTDNGLAARPAHRACLSETGRCCGLGHRHDGLSGHSSMVWWITGLFAPNDQRCEKAGKQDQDNRSEHSDWQTAAGCCGWFAF